MMTLQELLEIHLAYMSANLDYEFSRMSGKKLIITGGAGFLGYYLVQSVLHWNKNKNTGDRINVAVYDNYIRGVPAWPTSLSGIKDLTLVRQNMDERARTLYIGISIVHN